MGLTTFNIELKRLGEEKSFRYDVDFVNFQANALTKQYYCFTDLFQFSKNNRVAIEELQDDFFYSEIGNVSKEGEVSPVRLNFNERREEHENYYKKIKKGDIIKVNKNDILLSKVRPNLKKYVFIDDYNKSFFYTSAFIHLVPKKLAKILYHSFRTIFYKNLIAVSRQGKGYPTLKEDDLLYLKFDKQLIDSLLIKEKKVLTEINPIEKFIRRLTAKVKQPGEIINKIFARNFPFDLEKFEETKQIHNYYINLSRFGNNRDIRLSVKFHREAGDFVNRELKNITKKKLRDFISVPIVLGKGISPADYEEDGDYYYIAMANIKNWQFEKEDARSVSKEYSDHNKNKTVSKNDILIARSGEGTIGKVALIDDNLKGIFSDFTMRIRLKNYNPLFAYYYFRTEYFQYLIEINKKGLGNNTNIFPNQIQEFPMIDISLEKQAEIVAEIKDELDEQQKTIQKIEIERNKIGEIIKKGGKKQG